MQRRVNALEGLNPEDQLAWLLLRVVAELSPCTERSLLERILGSALLSRQASNSHTRELVCSALIKLNELTFIRFTNAQIAITNQGRQFLDELPAGGLGGQSAETSESWGYTSGTINRALRAPPWTLYIAPLREFVATLLARCIPVLNRLCQNRLGGTGGNMPQSLLISGVRARDVAFEAWKRKVAATFGSRAAWLKTVRHTSAQAAANIFVNWRPQSGAALWKNGKVRYLSLRNRLAGANRFVIFAGVVMLIALSTAGSVALLSGKRIERAREAAIASSRASPLVWFYDVRNHPKRSIFVKRNFSGATRIEGISIRGENASDQFLTAVQATLISDTGKEMKLTVSAAGSRRAQADAYDVPSRSEFSLEHGIQLDTSGQQAGMLAEEFLSKYGGMIFTFRYTVGGVQRTLIDYFSPSRLKTELVEAKNAEVSH